MSGGARAEAAGGPAVSVLMVARNAGAYVDDAIGTARGQSLRDIEIIVVDDGSTDDTRARAAAHAAADPRVRVIDGPRAGLAAVRNASLAAARGRRVAILDSDDLLHPRHLELLVEAAERSGCGIVAANMIEFRGAPGALEPAPFAAGPGWTHAREIDLAAYVRANTLFAREPALGYLKPLIDRGFLASHGIRYDPRLRIGEDYDFVARAMAAGARFLILPEPTYFYRRHDASTSFRLAASDLAGLLAADADAGPTRPPPALAAARAARRRNLRDALAHAAAVEALKARRPLAAAAALARRPSAARLLLRSVAEGVGRRLGRRAAPRAPAADSAPAILLLGAPRAGDAIDRLAAALADRGQTICRRPLPDAAAVPRLARGLPPAALLLLAEPGAEAAAAYLLQPAAARVRHEGGALALVDGATGAPIERLPADAGAAAARLVRIVAERTERP